MPGGNAGSANGSSAHERIQYAPTGRRDGQQIADKLHGLGCEMVFARRNHGIGIQPGQTLPRIGAEAALDAKDDIFALLAEFTDLRSCAAFVPRNDAEPLPARGLHGVREAGQLPPAVFLT